MDPTTVAPRDGRVSRDLVGPGVLAAATRLALITFKGPLSDLHA